MFIALKITGREVGTPPLSFLLLIVSLIRIAFSLTSFVILFQITVASNNWEDSVISLILKKKDLFRSCVINLMHWVPLKG